MKRFIWVGKSLFAADQILSIRRVAGIDKVVREFIVVVTRESIGGSEVPKHSQIWLTKAEAEPLIEALEAEVQGEV